MRRILAVAALTAGALLLLPTAAQAAPAAFCGDITQSSTGGNYGILNGTQIAVPVDLGLNLSHNALGLLGSASASGSDYTGGCVRHHHHHRRHHHHA